MFNLLEAEIYVQTPLDVEYREGVFHVTDYYGENCIVRRAIPPSVYVANLQRAQLALAKWQAECAGGAAEIHQLYPIARLAG